MISREAAPLHEPGLPELIASSCAGNLSFTVDPAAALDDAEVLWVTFDTPVNDADEADVARVRRAARSVAPWLRSGTLVLISSGARRLQRRARTRLGRQRDCRFACSPENLRLGKRLDRFHRPERVVVGCRDMPAARRCASFFSRSARTSCGCRSNRPR